MIFAFTIHHVSEVVSGTFILQREALSINSCGNGSIFYENWPQHFSSTAQLSVAHRAKYCSGTSYFLQLIKKINTYVH